MGGGAALRGAGAPAGGGAAGRGGDVRRGARGRRRAAGGGGGHLRAGADPPRLARGAPVLRALRGATAQADDLEVARPNGERAALEMGAAPVLDADGVPAYSVAVLRDITERRANETQVRESAERVQSMATCIGEPEWR